MPLCQGQNVYSNFAHIWRNMESKLKLYELCGKICKVKLTVTSHSSEHDVSKMPRGRFFCICTRLLEHIKWHFIFKRSKVNCSMIYNSVLPKQTSAMPWIRNKAAHRCLMHLDRLVEACNCEGKIVFDVRGQKLLRQYKFAGYGLRRIVTLEDRLLDDCELSKHVFQTNYWTIITETLQNLTERSM